jgi:hypothetical protein
VMGGMIVGGIVLVLFGVLATRGDQIQRWLEDRRLRKHTCHTTCTESRWCACGCRDGMYGEGTGTRCAVCGTEYAGVGIEVTQEVMMPPPGQTSWGWRREKQERIRDMREWERRHGHGL